MPSVEIRNLRNVPVGTMELSDTVFGAEINHTLLHEAVRSFMASQRSGTHATKGRGEVAGSGRKLWKQKGTGRARIGSIRSPLWRHGGTVHGPQPRSYAYKLPKKMLLGALRSALSAKLKDQAITVVEDFSQVTSKTKALRETLNKMGANRSVLLVDQQGNSNLVLSSRNLAGVELQTNRELHPYHVLKYKRMLISRLAIEKLQEVLQP
ncbi:MAG: 50S ribosomal protein L4 [Acidobacteria bacterium]|nr:50S ribosomal protein L4 [Acidobacteriota bacterium]